MESPIKIDGLDLKKLVERVKEIQLETPTDKKLIILLAGVPGSGKSTLSCKVVKLLNEEHNIKSLVLPQDGYHLYRSELAQMPDPEEAITRRGAPFTFNADAFLKTVKLLNDPTSSSEVIRAPSFDHKLKDPIEDDIKIDPDTKVVFIEGNYVLLKDPGWCELVDIADDSWFVTANKTLIRNRIIKRHLEAGIASNEQEAIDRADGSDLKNAKYIEENLFVPQILIQNN